MSTQAFLCPSCQRCNVVSGEHSKLHSGEYNACCGLVKNIVTQKGAEVSYIESKNKVFTITGSCLFNIDVSGPKNKVYYPTRSHLIAK